MNQDIDELAKCFDDESAAYDSETDTFHHKVSEYVVLQNILRELGNDRNALILDSGGGTGKYALALGLAGYAVELIDISPRSLEIAQGKFRAHNISVRTSLQNSESTAYASGTFDFVLLNGAVVSYTPDPGRLIKETGRILKPEGKVILDFFNTIGWSIEIKDPDEVSRIVSSDDYLIQMPDWKYPARLMSIPYVENLLRQSGFSVVGKKGLINITHAFPLDFRYSTDYSPETVKKYQDIEWRLSNRPDCVGTAWSCIMCGKKDR